MLRQWIRILCLLGLICVWGCADRSVRIDKEKMDFDPTTVLWYDKPVEKWDDAFPVGNGRLGAMVFGMTDRERIQLNEETYWSGGPYNQTRKGGYRHLDELQELIFEGKYIKAHNLFGRYFMGYPVEQMKYQCLANLYLKFDREGPVQDYRHELDLDEGLVTTRYTQDGIRYSRTVFSTPVDQVVVMRLTADQPGSISFTANLHGVRNQAHSNYATDYFQMDGYREDGLIVTGKSADYLGVEGKLRYEGRLKAIPEGGTMRVDDRDLIISDSDAVTLIFAGATNFVNYRDVSGNARLRNDRVFNELGNKLYDALKRDHIEAHQELFRRVSIDLGSTRNSFLPTGERRKRFNGENDPNLAALCFQFARYLLIASSRAGTQPANLRGIWNQDMNPKWDSKYTTNINLQMNYWPAEVAQLAECAEPLFRMIEELTDQGSDVARENYGARGWVYHQNSDLWRVAAPMDGPDWGTFTTGGVWLCTHLWEHYLFTEDRSFLRRVYPVIKGAAQFFLDFLVEHPKYGWLVTAPSTSPENFPGREGNGYFYDEVTGWNSPGTTICAGSTIDMQLLNDLFSYTVEAADILGIDRAFREEVLETKDRLAPMQIGRNGDLQEWLEDWDQKEGSHRHFSHLYGLFPGNQISARYTPELAEACKVVLEQRGLVGPGFGSAWKMACWARLYGAQKALDNFEYYIHENSFNNLFAICQRELEVDGALGVGAAVAEMLVQSHEDEIHLLPSCPDAWSTGEIRGLMARGGFRIDMNWNKGDRTEAEIESLLGNPCKVRADGTITVEIGDAPVSFHTFDDGKIIFDTEKNKTYRVVSTIQP